MQQRNFSISMVLRLMLLAQGFMPCYADTSSESLCEKFFHKPYIKMAVELPMNSRIKGYGYTPFADFHDKPSFGPFYLIGVGNKFRWVNLELEAFYLNLLSKTNLPPSTVSRTRFSGMGAFVNASIDIVRRGRNSIFIGGGIGVSENTAHDVVWVDNADTIIIGKGQHQVKPAFQVFIGVSHYINRGFAVESGLRYIYLDKFTTADKRYKGTFEALTFSISFKYNFSRYYKFQPFKKHRLFSIRPSMGLPKTTLS